MFYSWGLDGKLTQEESVWSKLLDALIQLALTVNSGLENFDPKAAEKSNAAVDGAAGEQKRDEKDGDDKASNDMEGIYDFLKELAALFKEVTVAWKDAGEEAQATRTGSPQNQKSRLGIFFKEKRKPLEDLVKKLFELKKLYKDNKLFKAVVDKVLGKVLKQVMDWATEALKAVPGIGTVVQGVKMIASAAKIGGKIANLFKAAKAAKMHLQKINLLQLYRKQLVARIKI